MFVGHYSSAFLAKRVEPRVPLWLLFVAAQLVDVFWDVLVLLGIEQLRLVPGITAANPLDLYYMPYTHSLVAAGVWSAAAFVACRWMGLEARGATVVGLVVGSHWLLDLLVHRPDLPLYGDAMKVGLGLWNAPLFEFALEIALLFGGIALYVRAPHVSPRKTRRILLLGGLLFVIQAISTFGPPPTSPTAVVSMALAVYVTLAILAGRADAAADSATTP